MTEIKEPRTVEEFKDLLGYILDSVRALVLCDMADALDGRADSSPELCQAAGACRQRAAEITKELKARLTP